MKQEVLFLLLNDYADWERSEIYTKDSCSDAG